MIELWKDQVRETDKDDWRWYRGEDGKARISVTKVLDGMKTERLQSWIAKTDYATQEKKRTTSAALGTKIHSAIENILKGDYALERYAQDPEAADIAWACNEFLKWKADKPGLEIQAVEGAAASEFGYAGTFDFVANGILYDIKTGGFTETAGYQLAAYRFAFERAGVPLQGMAVLNIRVRDHRVMQFDYKHYDFCLQRFLAIFEGWKGLSYKKLDSIGYEWLHQYSPSIVFDENGKFRQQEEGK